MIYMIYTDVLTSYKLLYKLRKYNAVYDKYNY